MTELTLELRRNITELLGRAAQGAPGDAEAGWRFVRACIGSGDRDGAVDGLKSLTANHPGDVDAWWQLTELLIGLNRIPEAVAAGRGGTRAGPGNSRIFSSYGFALRAAGDDVAADEVFATAFTLDPCNPYAVRGAGQTLVARAAATELLEHCRAAMTRIGASSWLIAQYAIALSLLGRHEPVAELLDYDRLVQERELTVPEGFASLGAFNQALRDELDRLQPEHESFAIDVLHEGFRVRGGPQAALAEFGRSGAPASAALLNAFEQERREYESWLSVGDDHLYRRARPGTDFVSADALLTSRQAYLSLHTHACTWLSAVYYAVVPPGMGEESKAGCMEFAPPLHKVALADGIWPSRLVRPRPGLFVFFPGYMYHHVHASALEGERLVIAFDVLPTSHAAVAPLSQSARLEPV
ncbi:MAG: putative 2OG-Fe(II) oxygenase [Allosphingosinicella sp.]